MAYMTRKYMTTDEVAQIFAMDPAGVRRWIRQKRLKAVNIGTDRRPVYRISEAELARYEAANTAA